MKTKKLIKYIKYGTVTSITIIFILGMITDIATAIWLLANNGEDSLFITGYIIGRSAVLIAITTLLIYFLKNYLRKEKEQ